MNLTAKLGDLAVSGNGNNPYTLKPKKREPEKKADEFTKRAME